MSILGNIVPRAKDAWSNTTEYIKNDLVGYQGSMYLAKDDVPVGTLPTNTTYWMLCASKGDPGVNGDPEELATALATTLDDAKDYTDGKLDELVINVKSYGAAGNGSTDDTTAIQSCIDLVSAAGGGRVFLPPGTYKITATLTVPKFVKLDGSGYGSKIKQYTNAIPIIHLTGATDVFRAAVSDLWIGFNSAQTDPNGNGIQLANTNIMCYECEINNVFIDQPYNGIICKNLSGGYAWMNVFKHVKVMRNYHYAFYLYNPDAGACTTTTFINCYAIQDSGNIKPTAGGFYIRNMTDCTLIGCAVDEFNLGKILYIMSSSATVIGMHVENCNIISAAGGNAALFTISGSVVNILGMRMENMVINKATGESYTFEINSDSLVHINGFNEYNSSKVSGDHYSIAPDGTNTAIYIYNWKGMFGSFGEWAPPYKVKVYNGDNRTIKVGGKTRAYGSAMPSSGSWTKDDYIENTNRSVLGTSPNKYILKGWIRITTGSNNVLNTDWFEDRALTGT